jgi:hypothetical protein
MPERAFVSQNITQLKATLGLLEKAMQGGSLEELRVSGIVTRNGVVSQRDLETRYKQCRYELYLQAQALPDVDGADNPDKTLYTNPYIERVMRVESRYCGGNSFFP